MNFNINWLERLILYLGGSNMKYLYVRIHLSFFLLINEVYETFIRTIGIFITQAKTCSYLFLSQDRLYQG